MLEILLNLLKSNPQLISVLLPPILRAIADAVEKNPDLLQQIITEISGLFAKK